MSLRPATWVVVCTGACGCAVIGGFDDFHRECPLDKPGCALIAGRGGTAGASVRGNGNGGGREDAAEGGPGDGARNGNGGGSASGGRGSSGSGAIGSGGDGFGGGAGGHAGSAGAEAGSDCFEPTSSWNGSPMTRVVRPDGSAFLIDRTEVTNGEYDEFLRSKPKPSAAPLCLGAPNTDPTQLSSDCQMLLESDGGSEADLPRVCVSWCDAEAYCQWAGKDLCRDTNLTLSDSDLRKESDFFAACTQDAARTSGARPVYSCRSACGASDCNGADAEVNRPLAVGRMPDCRVGPAECSVADLSGNVAEWTGACAHDTSDGQCIVRGGSFDSRASDLECGSKALVTRTATFTTIGFRCCVALP